jgi:hypothetical protein
MYQHQMFCKLMSNLYQLNKIMQQSNMLFIQTLNKFRIMTKTTKGIQCKKSICY